MTLFEVIKEICFVLKTYYLAFSLIKEHRNKQIRDVFESNLTLNQKIEEVGRLFAKEKENRNFAAKKLQDFFKERYK